MCPNHSQVYEPHFNFVARDLYRECNCVLRYRKAQAVPTQTMRPIRSVGFVRLQGPAKDSLNLPMPPEWMQPEPGSLLCYPNVPMW